MNSNLDFLINHLKETSIYPKWNRRCGSILVSYKRCGWVASSGPFTVMTHIFSENI